MTQSAFSKIAAGLEDAIAIARGEADPTTYRVHPVPETVDVRTVRERRGMTQAQFAEAYGFTLGRLRDWERGHSDPKGAERVLLRVIERKREAVERALAT